MSWYGAQPEQGLHRVPGVRSVAWVDGQLSIHQTHLPLTEGYQPLPLVTRPLSIGPYAGRDYQLEAAEFARCRDGALLAHQMRLGKTWMAAASLDQCWEEDPILIVAPLATRSIWLKWLGYLIDPERILVLKGKTYDSARCQRAQAIFCHYDILTHWQNFGTKKFSKVIFDEIHLISNRKSKRGQAAQLVSHAAGTVLGLTGTPLWNTPAGLYNLLHCISLGAWGSFGEFITRYAGATETRWGYCPGEPSHQEEFKARLTEVMVRKTWKEVRSELPPVERSIEVADLKPSEAVKIDREIVAKDPKHLLSENSCLRQLLGEAKLKASLRLARSVLDSGESVVVWTWHKRLARELQNKLNGFRIDGDMSQEHKDFVISSWMSKDEPKALIATIGSAQVGIDLSKARHCIFAEIDYTPAVVAQAEMRTFDSDKANTVTYVVVDHPFERSVVRCLVKKCRAAYEMGTPAAETAIELLEEAFGGEDPGLSAILEGL